jgi:hypothetical protein
VFQRQKPRFVSLAAAVVLAACAPSGVVGYDAFDASAEDDATGDAIDASTVDAAALDAQAADDAVRGPLSGLAWPSGAHAGNESASYQAYAEFRGRPLDLATLYPDRGSWAGLVTPGWPLSAFEDFAGRLVLSEPLYPPSMGNLQDCAAGAYDAEWEKLGSFLVDHGRADTILRLGWGGTDPSHAWHADADPADYITCYRRIVRVVRAHDPDVLFDFSFDALPSRYPASGDPYDLYPGDDYVDIVGMDVFDRDPPTRTEEEWQSKCEGPLGLCTLIAFARAHQKRWAVGEWGVATCAEDPGGDNPFFIEKMLQTFRAHADILAYEAYFDDRDAGVCSTLVEPDNAPEARAAYQRAYAEP